MRSRRYVSFCLVPTSGFAVATALMALFRSGEAATSSVHEARLRLARYLERRLIRLGTWEDKHVEPSEDLLSDVRDGVLRVTFNRPQARNALTFAMYERLAALCRAAGEDKGVRAVLLTGAGDKAFAAGTDIAQFREFSSPEDALRYEERVERAVSTVEACPKPTIAAIAGACTGGGAAIAAACDLRIATPDARFGFPIARTLGNCLSMANYARLAALIGPARTKDIIFTARLVEAEEAQAIGLVGEVVPDIAALMLRAETLARTVAANAPLTLRATKEALRRLRPTFGEDEGRDLILMCYMSRDFREGLDAFLSKRAPAWTGE